MPLHLPDPVKSALKRTAKLKKKKDKPDLAAPWAKRRHSSPGPRPPRKAPPAPLVGFEQPPPLVTVTVDVRPARRLSLDAARPTRREPAAPAAAPAPAPVVTRPAKREPAPPLAARPTKRSAPPRAKKRDLVRKLSPLPSKAVVAASGERLRGRPLRRARNEGLVARGARQSCLQRAAPALPLPSPWDLCDQALPAARVLRAAAFGPRLYAPLPLPRPSLRAPPDTRRAAADAAPRRRASQHQCVRSPRRQLKLTHYHRNRFGYYDCPLASCVARFLSRATLRAHVAQAHAQLDDGERLFCSEHRQCFVGVDAFNEHHAAGNIPR